MKFFSTKNKDFKVDLKQAVLQSLPPDNGLYMPEEIPKVPKDVIDRLDTYSFQEIAEIVATPFLKDQLTASEIMAIIEQAISFPAPVVSLTESIHILELWHGPSLAFKDFGARFMAALMSRLVENESRKLTILVATSGDTGGAVASGFLGVDNVEVIILYPSKKVSPLQEAQLTTLGQNITALEISGTFDDCQHLVKTAFLDKEINSQYLLSSANSINISRLIPQSFYYFEAFKQLENFRDSQIVFCVPSGNFGNLTAGLLAKRMGLPIHRFIAATNINDVVLDYLETGNYRPRASQSTISNAMDVGDPSNFRRMENLFGGSWNQMKEDIVGYSFTDQETRAAITEVFEKFNYVIDPHGAVAYLAAKQYLNVHPGDRIIVHETAHPSKFLPVMQPLLGEIDVPGRLAELKDREKRAIAMSTDFGQFKEWMLQRK